MKKTIHKLATVLLLCVLSLPLILYASLHQTRPPRTNIQQPLFQGITYKRQADRNPRPLMVHIVTLDFTAPGINVLVTPGNPTPDNRETTAQTTTEFLNEFNLQLAINANFFYPFREETPWNYYPHSGDRTNAVGLAISNGVAYSKPKEDWPALCFLPQKQASIKASGSCPDGTLQGIAGSAILVSGGKPVKIRPNSPNNDGLYARTAIGIDPLGQKLWIVVVDDKQPFYSEGVTLAELTEIFLDLGVDAALNLDGGGSTTLVVADGDRHGIVLNSPVHTKLPMRQRPVANNLGFYAAPL